MSDSGSSWWLGADRLWRKGQPPSGWHQTRDGLWHPPPTAATRLKAETPSASRVRVGAHAGSLATATLPGERWRAAAEAYNRTTGDLDDEDAGPDAGAGDDEDGEGGFADFDGYETAYYESADAYGRDLVDGGDDSDVDDDGYDEEGRARHMAGGRPPELWANPIDRVLAWPTWVRVALSASAMVVLLGGLGIAVAGAGGDQTERAGGTDDDGSSVEQTDGEGDGLTTTSSSSLSTTTAGPGTSTSSSTTDPSGPTSSVPGSTESGNGAPTGDGAASPPPPSPPDPTTPTSSAPRPPSTTTPTTAPQDPYRYCEGLERLFPTDPDGDGIFCE